MSAASEGFAGFAAWETLSEKAAMKHARALTLKKADEIEDVIMTESLP